MAVLFKILIPLIPIGIELATTATLTDRSATLASAMFAIGIGTSSRNPAMLAFTIFSSVLSAIQYGASLDRSTTALGTAGIASIVTIVLFTVAYTCERFNRHVVDREVYFEFMKPGSDS